MPYVYVIRSEIVEKGASALIAETVVRVPDHSINPLVKNYHWGDFTKGLFEAKDQSYETVILADIDGNITEGPGFNVFAVKGETVITSDHGALGGISRKTVLEMAKKQGLEIEVRALPKSEFLQADEVFISSSGGGVIPIVNVNGTIYANGTCGPITQKLHSTYWAWTKERQYRTEIDYQNYKITNKHE